MELFTRPTTRRTIRAIYAASSTSSGERASGSSCVSPTSTSKAYRRGMHTLMLNWSPPSTKLSLYTSWKLPLAFPRELLSYWILIFSANLLCNLLWKKRIITREWALYDIIINTVQSHSGHSIAFNWNMFFHFVTLWTWPFAFWPNIKRIARTRDGLSLWQVWWLWFHQFWFHRAHRHTDRTLYSRDSRRRE